MRQVKQQDLREFTQEITPTLANVGELTAIGGVAEGVPETMRRYVYYWRPANKTASGVTLSIFESVGGNLKLVLQSQLTQYTEKDIPNNPDWRDGPLWAFQQSGFIAAQTSGGNIALTVGYYDAPPE